MKRDILYAHVYVDINENKISYNHMDSSYELGMPLMDFVSYDLEQVRVNLDSKYKCIDYIKNIYPYFEYLNDDAVNQFILNSIDPESSDGFDLNYICELQEKYRAFAAYVAENSIELKSRGEHVYPLPDLLKDKKLFSSMQIVESEDGQVYEDYLLMDLEACLFFEALEVYKRKLFVKKCKNCGKYFIPVKANIDYCLRVYKDEKTCSDVGYSKTFAKTVKNDEILQAYTRAYKAHYARMTKPRKNGSNMTRDEFEAWYSEAKEKLNQARNGVLGKEAFKEWLKI